MSGVTDFLGHPRRSLAGIHLKRNPVADTEGRKFLRDLGAADGVGVCPEPDGLSWMVIKHMADRSTPAGDFRETHECSCSYIESEEAIGMQAGFHEPDTVLVINGHSVWSGVGSPGYRPFFDVQWIE